MNDKWEYQTLYIRDRDMEKIDRAMEEIDARLNSLGQEGWEVLSHNNDINFSRHYFILKRKISS